MITFLSLLLAVIALLVALQAHSEVVALRRRLGEQPVTPPPPPQELQQQKEPEIAFYQPPAAANAAAEAEREITPPLPPPPVQEAPAATEVPHPGAAPPRPSPIDWENLVGIRLFSWIAGIALVLAAVFLFKYSVEHGWLRPAIRAGLGLVTGAGLLAICELRIARGYRFTANALDGAGIAILYATLFALYARWHLWPASASFAGMLIVTVIAVVLSTRRDSIFIALLGLIGGFATPALLSSGENRPVALFSYLLFLNGGIAWIAWQKRWPLLTAASVVLTAFYQWVWIERFLTSGQLPLAAAIFLVFAIVGASSLWPARGADAGREAFRRIASAGAVLPLLFAFFTAIVPEYGAQYHVLFGFLLLMVAGLAAIALWRGPLWLHALGAAATFLTFFIWVVVSYTPNAWPGIVGWLGVFVAFYLAAHLRIDSRAVYVASLLFFLFFALAVREPLRYQTLAGSLFALLTVVVAYSAWRSTPNLASIAIALSVLSLLPLEAMPAPVLTAAYAILFGALLLIARLFDRPSLSLLAIPLYAIVLVATIDRTPAERVVLAAVIVSIFLVYAVAARRNGNALRYAYSAAVLANVLFFIAAWASKATLPYASVIGLVPLTQALLLALLLHREVRMAGGGDQEIEPSIQQSTLAILGGAALGFVTTAIAVQLQKEWITIAFALEAAALVWLFSRVPHRGLLGWSGGLAVIVFVRLVLNPAVIEYHDKASTPLLNWFLYAYVTCAAAMFFIARRGRQVSIPLARFAAAAGTIELFVLLNIQIADYYSTGRTLTFDFMSSSLAQDLTYTIGWALFAMAMLVTGIVSGWRSARIAALGLLLVTILKCFLHDLARLGGLYRVGSLFGLAVALVIVGLLLQKFVMMKREINQPVGS